LADRGLRPSALSSMMVSVLRRLRTRTGLSLIAGMCLMLALFLVNLLAICRSNG
jgi:hypothetical protein